ncbi:MAG: hypothetical protein EZS28_026348, partial [Streblomastix strix]
ILDEQNGEARRREIQCPSLLPITSILLPNEVLDSKRSLIDKILQCQQALALYNFRIGEEILAHLCEEQQEQQAIDVLIQIIYNLREAERTHFTRSRNENGTNTNYFNLAVNSIISHLDSQAASHQLGAHVIATSNVTNKDAIGITNLLFEIQQLGQAKNENQALEQNQETHNGMPPLIGPRGHPPPGQEPTGPYTPRNVAKPQAKTFPPALNAQQEIPEIPNVMTIEVIKFHKQAYYCSLCEKCGI